MSTSEATRAGKATTEKETRNATEAQGAEGRDSGHVGGRDDTATHGKAGSHEADWTQNADTIEGDNWMRFFWKGYLKTAETTGREAWLRFFRNRYLKTVMEREVWTRFFWECYLKVEPEDMEWWNWRMILPRNVYKRRTSDKKKGNKYRLETRREYKRRSRNATREQLEDLHRTDLTQYGAAPGDRIVQGRLKGAVDLWLKYARDAENYDKEGGLRDLHEGVKSMTAEVWKEFITREAESNGKNEDMRRFREGTRTLIKIIDREIFIAEQIEGKVKEHFTEGT